MTGRPARTAALAFITVVTAAALFGAGRLTADPGQSPGPNQVDVGFAQDMREHHSQAATMSLAMLERAADPEVRRLARDIGTAQLMEIGTLGGWLMLWARPEQSDHTMSWLPADAPHAVDRSMGMASGSDLRNLSTLPVAEAERLFLTLMRTHHLAGIHMAHAAADRANISQLRDLARAMAAAQELDIARIDRLTDIL
ncbi:DUF305 domain-containing protein [Nocardia sp. NPDC052566]|uniref:DUF305 domain-containing protein n=1 Tax=Nocardia sp. NPDC052566 TaxID=3364330 RepID=UPI0037C55D1C